MRKGVRGGGKEKRKRRKQWQWESVKYKWINVYLCLNICLCLSPEIETAPCVLCVTVTRKVVLVKVSLWGNQKPAICSFIYRFLFLLILSAYSTACCLLLLCFVCLPFCLQKLTMGEGHSLASSLHPFDRHVEQVSPCLSSFVSLVFPIVLSVFDHCSCNVFFFPRQFWLWRKEPIFWSVEEEGSLNSVLSGSLRWADFLSEFWIICYHRFAS